MLNALVLVLRRRLPGEAYREFRPRDEHRRTALDAKSTRLAAGSGPNVDAGAANLLSRVIDQKTSHVALADIQLDVAR